MSDYEVRRFFIDAMGSIIIQSFNKEKSQILDDLYIATPEQELLSDFILVAEYYKPEDNTQYFIKNAPNKLNVLELQDTVPSSFNPSNYSFNFTANYELDPIVYQVNQINDELVTYKWQDQQLFAIIPTTLKSYDTFFALMKMC